MKDTYQIIKTKINGYDVQLEIDPLDDPSTQCDIIKGDYSSSLSCLSHEGYLTNSTDHELPVSDRVIHKIEDWAEANGW